MLLSKDVNQTPQSAASHAVVIGGSMAGLVTGRVLADYFDRVTIHPHTNDQESIQA
jgi:hypothetical protein